MTDLFFITYKKYLCFGKYLTLLKKNYILWLKSKILQANPPLKQDSLRMKACITVKSSMTSSVIIIRKVPWGLYLAIRLSPREKKIHEASGYNSQKCFGSNLELLFCVTSVWCLLLNLIIDCTYS